MLAWRPLASLCHLKQCLRHIFLTLCVQKKPSASVQAMQMSLSCVFCPSSFLLCVCVLAKTCLDRVHHHLAVVMIMVLAATHRAWPAIQLQVLFAVVVTANDEHTGERSPRNQQSNGSVVAMPRHSSCRTVILVDHCCHLLYICTLAH